MSETNLPQFEAVEAALQTHGLAVTPSELHGLLAGMVCGGLPLDGHSWLPAVCDYANEGNNLTDGATAMARTLYQAIVAELTGEGFDFSLLLTDEDSTLVERADSLSEWVNCFLSGLGLMAVKADQLSEDVKEALEDLQEIAQLGIDEDDDMEEQAAMLEQVIEHVRMCAMTCHAELGERPAPETSEQNKPTLH